MNDRREKALSVTELTRQIKSTLEGRFRMVSVEGECSNVTPSSRGHLYFTLKDAGAAIAAVRFGHATKPLGFELKDGVKVRVEGPLSLYEPRGNYQLIAHEVELAGKGALQEQFEQLKRKLKAEGLFEATRKKPLPMLPRRIGIVTSPHGAAVRDVLNVLNRRFPNLHVIIAPVRVQGDAAAKEIASAVQLFNKGSSIDVILVTRGGGSLEDLWAFNEEVVARSIAASRIPVVSAVGHEIDFSISDFVADLRAPTPSAAAELIVGRKDAYIEQVAEQQRRLSQSLRRTLLEEQRRFERLSNSFVFREPANLVRRHRDTLERAQERSRSLLLTACQDQRSHLQARQSGLVRATEQRIHRAQQQLDEVDMSLGHAARNAHGRARHRLEKATAQLRALSPFQVLERGFSITRTEAGDVVRRPEDAAAGTVLRTHLAKGELRSEVLPPEPDTDSL